MASAVRKEKSLDLFGGSEWVPLKWNADIWTASDDSVRGGKSSSHLDISSADSTARFYGHLDIQTLGGAGFASQKTSGDWDLSEYGAIQLHVKKGDKKRYTFILKDKLLSPNPENGREQATISYEADFDLLPQTIPGNTHDRTVIIPFASLNATYRGKLQKDAPALDTNFFGTQEGDFSLTLDSITVIAKIPKHNDDSMYADAWQLEEGTKQSKEGADHMHGPRAYRRLIAVLLTGVAALALTYRLKYWLWP
ncbi:hypothetical protein LTR56_015245 [Elasticomyces elasticus]|nr:hypothetical protein LTR56_015245 [Elasticomyces elasticus]KAK3644292.1 hypothetical protein LTR22_015296 [Elasticomyces elasticus]KAK4905553.1 hypothetical protein LTR49_025184 [Elasticomyces elasticus]